MHVYLASLAELDEAFNYLADQHHKLFEESEKLERIRRSISKFDVIKRIDIEKKQKQLFDKSTEIKAEIDRIHFTRMLLMKKQTMDAMKNAEDILSMFNEEED